MQSEDCLHLDVWTPNRPAGRPLPVLVFVYGGGSLTGHSAWYNLSALAADHGDSDSRGAVVIAINYRLGPLGFMATKELSTVAATGTSGNFGLQDCELAVEWAVRHAASFGGDPGSVTMLGQSSGASMIWGLMGHRRAKTTFQKAIILSGSPNIGQPRLAAERQNSGYAQAVGCDAPATTFTNATTNATINATTNATTEVERRVLAVVACLRSPSTTAAALSYGHSPVNDTWQQYGTLTWGVPLKRYGSPLPGKWPTPAVLIVDGSYLTTTVLASMAAGVNSHLDLLVSNVGEEDDLAPNLDFSGNGSDLGPLREYLGDQLAPWGAGLAGALLNSTQYRGLPPQQAYLQIAGHIGTTCGQHHLMEAAALRAHGPGKLYYTVVEAGPSLPQTLGVASIAGYVNRYSYHQSDLLWAMEQWNWFADFAGVAKRYVPTLDDMAQARLFRTTWLAFAQGDAAVSRWTNLTEFGAADRVVGVVGKTAIVPTPGYLVQPCATYEQVGLWVGFWWQN